MSNREHIVRYTSEEIQHLIAVGQDLTDWDRLDAMSETAIDAAVDETAEGQPDWLHAVVELPRSKQQLTVRFDIDVINWFRAQGAGYQTKMNQVLRRYVEAHRR